MSLLYKTPIRSACVVIALLAVTPLAAAEPGEPVQTTTPNVILIMADDLGYGDLSCYDGWIQTPHIDALARDGLRFVDFHSNGVVCSPTRASLLTGRYPHRVGIDKVIVADRNATEHRNGLAADETTLAEVFLRAGYATAIFGKWHLGYYPEFNPVAHGFQRFRGYVSGNVDYFSHVDQAGHFDWWQDIRKQDEEGYVTHLINEHAVRFIERNRDQPFFLYLPHEAPHYPYQGPNDSARRVAGQTNRRGRRGAEQKPVYRQMVEEVDRGVGEILATLRRLDLQRQTLVFFLSDNGATRLGSNGVLRGHKGTVWEGGHRVPAIAHWPGRIKARENDTLVTTMDLMPTLTALIGHPTNRPALPIDGIDIRPILFDNAPLPYRPVYWQYRRGEALRYGQWCLVAQKDRGALRTQLFDLSTDLQQSTNVADDYPEVYDLLQNQLAAFRAEL